MPKENKYLVENAVKLSRIEPDHVVAEIGFGSGLGLKCALETLKGLSV